MKPLSKIFLLVGVWFLGFVPGVILVSQVIFFLYPPWDLNLPVEYHAFPLSSKNIILNNAKSVADMLVDRVLDENGESDSVDYVVGRVRVFYSWSLLPYSMWSITLYCDHPGRVADLLSSRMPGLLSATVARSLHIGVGNSEGEILFDIFFRRDPVYALFRAEVVPRDLAHISGSEQ